MPTVVLRTALLSSVLAVVLTATPAAAQRTTPAPSPRRAAAVASADTLSACYVPGSGTVYRVGAPGAPAQCSAGHAAFRWAASAPSADGGKSANGLKPTDPSAIDHGALAGLGDDDHTQYLLAEGVRQGMSGFAVTGVVGSTYPVPVAGAGKRLMWAASKGALRAGLVSGTQWDESNVGFHSTAFGLDVIASGYTSFAVGQQSSATAALSFALGYGARASGGRSVAIGSVDTASGERAIALGNYAVASGASSMAIGFNVTASGAGSTAMGVYASTNAKAGTFVYGDNSGGGAPVALQASRDNQFAVRAQHFWLGKTNAATNPAGHFITTSTGAYLSNGGTWTNSSDVNRKHAFQTVDGDSLLAKLAAMPITSWSYRDESESVRHVGPTAQDFHAAFGLGDSETAIATVDADGVSLAAIQALERRTVTQARTLAELADDNAALRAELRAVRDELRQLRGSR